MTQNQNWPKGNQLTWLHSHGVLAVLHFTGYISNKSSNTAGPGGELGKQAPAQRCIAQIATWLQINTLEVRCEPIQRTFWHSFCLSIPASFSATVISYSQAPCTDGPELSGGWRPQNPSHYQPDSDLGSFKDPGRISRPIQANTESLYYNLSWVKISALPCLSPASTVKHGNIPLQIIQKAN